MEPQIHRTIWLALIVIVGLYGSGPSTDESKSMSEELHWNWLCQGGSFGPTTMKKLFWYLDDGKLSQSCVLTWRNMISLKVLCRKHKWNGVSESFQKVCFFKVPLRLSSSIILVHTDVQYLCIGAIPEGIKNFLDSHRLACLAINSFPHDPIGLET